MDAAYEQLSEGAPLLRQAARNLPRRCPARWMANWSDADASDALRPM